MFTLGHTGLFIAFFAAAVSVLGLFVGNIRGRRGAQAGKGESLVWGGHIAVLLTAVALSVCCGVLVYCFLIGDNSIQYVVKYRSDASGPLAVLFKLSGLWGGREGSLLFWAWLISLFNVIIALRNLRRPERLDSLALFVSQAVLLAFIGVLLFSETNMPFVPLPAAYLDPATGALIGAAKLWGLNPLLEHWAMAIHPSTLFIGYAGLTIPFAYAVAALIANDPSKRWVEKSRRFALVSWLFLGIGIGLGAVWAYVVLGWGGYWGWDPVENASLLSWILSVALIHSFTAYRQRGIFKRWTVLCACLTFAFVILGTFITRSGLVQNSVHAFEGDTGSLVLFLALMVVAVGAGLVGLVLRRQSFGQSEISSVDKTSNTENTGSAGKTSNTSSADKADNTDKAESLLSKDVAYYFNNAILLASALVITYMTISSALPDWLPLGGKSLAATTYDAIARPLGILYCLIMAVCPLLGWVKTDKREFLGRLKVPGIAALIVFVGLVYYFVTSLAPGYDAMIAAGGSHAATLQEAGPRLYYFGLTLAGFFAASLLFFNSLIMLARIVSLQAKAKGSNVFVAFFNAVRRRASSFGGFLSHLAIAVILVGLIGSSMYVTERAGYMPYDSETDTVAEDFEVGDYRLTYVSKDIELQENKIDILYSVTFDVYRGEEYVGQVSPAVQLVTTTEQHKLVAEVLSSPAEDLFVVYNGVSETGEFSLDVRVNPLISFVWVGFGLLILGTAVAAFGCRKRTKKIPS
jgi:cytochrome c-type biogenesis protein CcmF